MNNFKRSLIVLSSFGLMFLTACSNNTQATNPTSASSPASSSSAPAETAANTNQDHSQPAKGGQVVETGKYHLEFVPVKEADGTHLDLYLLKGDNHEPVANAKVKAQVQLPNGQQKSLDFTYDAAGKHYAVLLPEKASGEYKVVILSDVEGEKVNSRFSFNR